MDVQTEGEWQLTRRGEGCILKVELYVNITATGDEPTFHSGTMGDQSDKPWLGVLIVDMGCRLEDGSGLWSDGR